MHYCHSLQQCQQLAVYYCKSPLCLRYPGPSSYHRSCTTLICPLDLATHVPKITPTQPASQHKEEWKPPAIPTVLASAGPAQMTRNIKSGFATARLLRPLRLQLQRHAPRMVSGRRTRCRRRRLAISRIWRFARRVVRGEPVLCRTIRQIIGNVRGVLQPKPQDGTTM